VRTLVTGGAGFIGSWLVRRLVELGGEVVVLDRLDEQVHRGEVPAFADAVKFVAGDLCDETLVEQALAGVDRVVHLAAAVGVGQSMYEIRRYVESNTLAAAVFLERIVARASRPLRLVVASSMSIYGEGEYECELHGHVAPPPRDEAQLVAREWEIGCPICGRSLRAVGTRESKPVLPTSVYAITKRDHEELFLVVGRAYGIPTVALRFFNVYGPGQALSNPYTGIAAIFASRFLNGRRPIIFEDGEQSRDFVHVSDVVEGIVLALESERAVDRALNLGTGRPSTVNDVARALSDGLGMNVGCEVTGKYRAGDIRHCYADPTLARELLGFEARVRLEEGMSELVGWLAHQEAEDRVEAAAQELAARGLAR
jgi:dTDP-L-rhamnose 4-epimerase